MEFVRTNTAKESVFIIPTHLTSFRLTTGNAIVADNNLVYGLSLSDQLQRISDVTDFYNEDWTDEEQLLTFRKKHGATAVLVPSSKHLPALSSLKEIYRNSDYIILE